jgi:thiol-disulfide isomerase/thioredoxin
MPALDGATTWLNSAPLTPSDLQGRVVVVEFLTYTCINWLRTLPYVRAWHERYGRFGVTVIGIHTPEFPFEADLDNVRRALGTLGVEFAVAVDNDYAIWEAFANHYWPALYFAGVDGRIRHQHFGEGAYDKSERVIQELLAEAEIRDVPDDLVVPDVREVERPADEHSLRSGETYLGYERSESFGSPERTAFDTRHTYSVPSRLGLNQWALAGDWTVHSSAVSLDAPGGTIAFRFHARDVNVIMGAASPDMPAHFRVQIDGQPPGDAHGLDAGRDGDGVATEPRMYQLIRQQERIHDRLFEIEFADAGVAAYDFTFG